VGVGFGTGRVVDVGADVAGVTVAVGVSVSRVTGSTATSRAAAKARSIGQCKIFTWRIKVTSPLPSTSNTRTLNGKLYSSHVIYQTQRCP